MRSTTSVRDTNGTSSVSGPSMSDLAGRAARVLLQVLGADLELACEEAAVDALALAHRVEAILLA